MVQKSKNTAYFLAFFFGGLGAHLFYLGKYVRGVLYVLFCWTLIPIILGWLDMFFISKWVCNINNPEGNKYPVNSNLNMDIPGVPWRLGNNPPDPNDALIFTKTKAFIKTINEDSVLDNESIEGNSSNNIILPQFAHLKTPQFILDSLQELCNPETHDGITIEFSMSTYDTEFIKESLKKASMVGAPCEPQPLMTYYTTFRDLNRNQEKWYLYWRTQVLNGNYPDIDLSYIFLFVYELINYSFNQDAAFNVSMLVRLYENYIERYPKLNNYLPVWIADFLIELGEEELAREWREDQSRFKSFYDYLMENKNNLQTIPITKWKPYLKYRDTKFFESNKTKIYKVFKRSLPILQDQYARQGRCIVDEWFEIKKKTYSRTLFAGAVIGRQRNSQDIVTTEYTPKPNMIMELTELFRLSENITRRLKGEKRQLRINNEYLPKRIQEIITEQLLEDSTVAKSRVGDRFKAVKPKTGAEYGSSIPTKDEATVKTPDIDLERVKALQQESESLQKEFEKDNQDLGINDKPQAKQESKPIISTNTDDSVDLFGVLSDNEINVHSFVENLTQDEKCFLAKFDDNELPIADAHTYIKEIGQMPGVFISGLNEKAVNYLGDTLIETSDMQYICYEEFDNILLEIKKVV